MPSFYQADLFRELSRTGEVELRVVFTARIPRDRVKLGWRDDMDGFDYEFIDNGHPIWNAFTKARKMSNRIHIVNGLWAGKTTETVLGTLLLSGSKYLIYSEAPDPRYSVPAYKTSVQRIIGKRIVKNAAGFLSISHFAWSYFESYGAVSSKNHAFAYFRSKPAGSGDRTRVDESEKINIIFVGQFVQRKGVDILLEAIEPLLHEYDNLYLQLIGSGELEEHYRMWVSEKGLASRITFEAPIWPEAITGRMSQASLLVLPSRWDGWGLVVTEALMMKVPVIVSNMCGAADLVKTGANGFVFASEDTRDLRAKLSTFIEARLGQRRPFFRDDSCAAVMDAGEAAKYLLDILKRV